MGDKVTLRSQNADLAAPPPGVGPRSQPPAATGASPTKSATKNAKAVAGAGNNLVTKNAVKMLSFPQAVEDDGQGHYIHFKIHTSSPAKVHSSKKPGQKSSGRVEALSQTLSAGSLEKVKRNRGGTKAGQRTYYASVSPPKRQLATSIALYMPASVSVSYGAEYGDSDIGIGTEAVVAAAQEYNATKGGVVEKGIGAVKAGINTFQGKGPSIAAQLGEKVGMTGLETMLAVGTGVVTSDRVELLFKRMSRREFSYAFTLVPQSGQEAKTIQEIVYLFKMHMHPEYTTGYGFGHLMGNSKEAKAIKKAANKANEAMKTKTKSGRFFKIPDTFDIEYMSYTSTNNYIHQISTCYLKNMQVTYGGDKFRAYDIQEGMFGEGAPPQTTVINLTFAETEVLTKESIAQGF